MTKESARVNSSISLSARFLIAFGVAQMRAVFKTGADLGLVDEKLQGREIEITK